MFKYLKQLTSLVAMVAVLFTFTTETMAAKKSKTLKNTQKKGFVRVEYLKVFQDFLMLMLQEIGLVLTLMYVER